MLLHRSLGASRFQWLRLGQTLLRHRQLRRLRSCGVAAAHLSRLRSGAQGLGLQGAQRVLLSPGSRRNAGVLLQKGSRTQARLQGAWKGDEDYHDAIQFSCTGWLWQKLNSPIELYVTRTAKSSALSGQAFQLNERST